MTHSWKKNFDLSLFFRRHNRLLTFAGALIVFVTFLVKEGKRESLKDLADSVDAAESVFVIRSDSFTTPVQLARMEEKIDEIGRVQYRDSKIKDMDMKEMRFFVHFAELMQGDVMFLRTSKALDNASHLFEKLPRRPRLIEERIHVLNSMVAKYRRSAEYGTGTVSLSNVREPDSSEFRGLAGLSKKVDDLANEILDDAEEARVSTEKSYAIYTWASYGLYTLGWGLGLVGRLYGVSGPME